jgi:hypothetical protein
MVEGMGESDIVVGSRYHPRSEISRTVLRVMLGRTYATMLRVLLRSHIRDYQCGFKGFRKSAGLEIIKCTESAHTFWDTEFLFYAGKLGFSIREMPVEWKETPGRSVKISLKLIVSFALSAFRLVLTGSARCRRIASS